MENFQLIDFKTLELNCHVKPDIGEKLELHAESQASGKTHEDFDGFIFVYFSTKVSDTESDSFLFDITTESVIKVPDGTADVTEDMFSECLPAAQERTYRAIYDISKGMGINPIDFGGYGEG